MLEFNAYILSNIQVTITTPAVVKEECYANIIGLLNLCELIQILVFFLGSCIDK